MKRRSFSVGIALLIVAIAAGALAVRSAITRPEPTGQVVIYSSRNESYVTPVIEKFTQETGIQVKLLTARVDIVNKILEEQGNVQADVLLSNDVGEMEYLRLRGALQPIRSPALKLIPAMYRAADGSWAGTSARTRVLMYNKDLITEEEMPKTLWELTDPKWKGQFMITRGGNASMVAHVAALRAYWGDAKTLQWLKALRANAGAITEGHQEIRRAVGAGEFKFGLVNNYYYHQQLMEPTDNNVGAIYPDQGPGEMGAFVNAAGVAMVKGAPHLQDALVFIEWLLQPAQQELFAAQSLEIPLDPQLKAVEVARPIGDYRVMTMPLTEIGPVWIDVKKLIEEAGLDLNL